MVFCPSPKQLLQLLSMLLPCVIVVTVIVKVVSDPSPIGDDKYCNLTSCKGVPHIMCTYTSEISENCRQCYEAGIKDSSKRKILEFWNSLDERFQLEWNDELSKIAQRWANQCKNDITDTCQNTVEMEVGQVAYHRSTFKKVEPVTEKPSRSPQHSIQDIMLPLLARMPGQDWHILSNENIPKMMSQAFIGCGFLNCEENNFNIKYLVCNYGPQSTQMETFMNEPKAILNDLDL